MADQYSEYLVFCSMIVYCVFVVFCRLAAFGSSFRFLARLLKGVTQGTDVTDTLACCVYFPSKVNELIIAGCSAFCWAFWMALCFERNAVVYYKF